MYWNVVQAIFQHNRIMQDCWKITRSTFKCLVIFKSRGPGDKVQKRWRTTRQICPVHSTRIWTLSPGLENTYTYKCWFGIFPTILTYIPLLKKKKTFQCMVVHQSRGQNFILVKISWSQDLRVELRHLSIRQWHIKKHSLFGSPCT